MIDRKELEKNSAHWKQRALELGSTRSDYPKDHKRSMQYTKLHLQAETLLLLHDIRESLRNDKTLSVNEGLPDSMKMPRELTEQQKRVRDEKNSTEL